MPALEGDNRVLNMGEMESFQVWTDPSSQKLFLDVLGLVGGSQVSTRYELPDAQASELLRQLVVHLHAKGISTWSLDAPNKLQ